MKKITTKLTKTPSDSIQLGELRGRSGKNYLLLKSNYECCYFVRKFPFKRTTPIFLLSGLSTASMNAPQASLPSM